jgi:hypothetical protein
MRIFAIDAIVKFKTARIARGNSWLCEHCYTVCLDDVCPERGQQVGDWDNDQICAMCLHEHTVDDLGDLMDEVYKDEC